MPVPVGCPRKKIGSQYSVDDVIMNYTDQFSEVGSVVNGLE